MAVPTEEFNARGRLSADVARTFVPPLGQFETLLTSDHHRLVGPRGSGKTTLLKMLTLDALRSWSNPNAAKYIERIRYNSVFIQTDRAWANQLQIASEKASVDIGDTAFCLHTLICLTQSMRSAAVLNTNPAVSHLVADFGKHKEIEFSKLISKTLGLDLVIPSFLGVEFALRQFLVNLFNPNDVGSAREKFSSKNLMSLITTMISAFNDLAGTPERRWAFLFDELEIAPQPIIQYLVNVMRGSDNRVILKLALAPYHQGLEKVQDPAAPMSWHDFATVRLTYANKGEAYDFTSELTRRIFKDQGITFTGFDDVFAPREPRAERRSRLEPYSVPEVFGRLADKDESFADYSRRRGLFNKNYTGSEKDQAADIRKILPIVTHREFYLKEFTNIGTGPERQRAVRRSRKSFELYTGAPSILEITEGNPRVVLTLMVPLARELAIRRESNQNERLTVAEQNVAVERAVHVLESLVRAIPLRAALSSVKQGLLELLDAIGNFFGARLLEGPFEADYIGTFTVDRNTKPDLAIVIGNALNAGALIYVPPEDNSGQELGHDLRGSRFRLSYLLAPRYNLPLTLGKVTSLSSILLASSAFRHNEPDLFRGGHQ